MYQQSALRLMSSEKIKFENHITLTNSEFRFIITEQLQTLGIDPGSILIEPMAKNTAAAILSACLFINNKDPEAILLVSPSDHVIPDTLEFHNAVHLGLTQVNIGKIVTFGITPTHPATGYGYLQIDQSSLDDVNISKIIKFIEKPKLSHAKELLDLRKIFE